MQLVKNVFLSGEKTLARKLQEIMLTWWMEQEVSKTRILEVYLNIVEWGPDIYGIGPASQYYFNCRPEELTYTQAVFLASILVNPSLFHYMKLQGELCDAMRNGIAYIMKVMYENERITEEEYTAAMEDNFEVHFHMEHESPDREEFRTVDREKDMTEDDMVSLVTESGQQLQ